MSYDDREELEEMNLGWEDEVREEEKIHSYIGQAKEQLLEDEDFLHDLKMQLTDNSNYLHSFMDSKYSKVEILRDKKNHMLLRGTFRLPIEGLDILGLKREYPNSHIRIINYEGRIEGVEITEQHHIERQ